MQVTHVRDYAYFRSLWEDYQALPKQLLRVTCLMGSSFIPASSDGVLHLDSVLASAVSLDVASVLSPLKKSEPKVISEDALPLFASSNLQPDATLAKSTDYWHKRFPAREVIHYCARPNTPTTRGVFKEYRVPMSILNCATLTAHCIANKAELYRLLSTYITFLGKKSAQGAGYVLDWQVEVDESATTLNDILSRRPVPSQYFGKPYGPLGGWTPPYWFRPWHKTLLT
jgi:hypothetical protein